MKKILIAGLMLALSCSYAQVNLTKDMSFADNGEYLYPDTGSYTRHKFTDSSILLSYTYVNSSDPYNPYAQFVRLNSDRSYNMTFGTNGRFIDQGGVGMPDTLADANCAFLITYTGHKYYSSGTSDTNFYINSSMNGLYQQIYSKLSNDGKILLKKNDRFTRLQADGNLDVSYGINGSVAAPIYSDDFQRGLIEDGYAYEFASGTGTGTTTGLRRINVQTGILESTYGVNGLGVTSTVPAIVRNSIYFNTDHSVINMLENNSSTGYQNSISKTSANGFLDSAFGTNGVFTLAGNMNNTPYTYYSQFYTNSSGKIFFLIRSDIGDIDIACYSSSGTLQNINNLGVLKPVIICMMDIQIRIFSILP